MTVNYIAVQRNNQGISEAPKRFYTRIKSRAELMFRKLSREIAEGSTIDTDMLAVLNDLTKILKRHLNNGKIVCFGDFGTFQVGVTSKGAETAEKFNASLIQEDIVPFFSDINLKKNACTQIQNCRRFFWKKIYND
jgi:predicted histone-like DNA-binding protein